jgi:hypothetical protein
VMGVVALLLAGLARREYRQPEMPPKTSTKQSRSTVLGAAKASPRRARGPPQGKYRGDCAGLRSLTGRTGHSWIFDLKFFGAGPSQGGRYFFGFIKKGILKEFSRRTFYTGGPESHPRVPLFCLAFAIWAWGRGVCVHMGGGRTCCSGMREVGGAVGVRAGGSTGQDRTEGRAVYLSHRSFLSS